MKELQSISLDTFCADEKTYLDLLKDSKNWQRIPQLNHTPLHQLMDHTLVRFRGMVQDMCDPEVYLEKYEVRDKNTGNCRIQNGKYRDCLVIGPDEETDPREKRNVRGDRRTIFIVSVPGMNDWVTDHEQSTNESLVSKPASETSNGHGQKRTIGDDSEPLSSLDGSTDVEMTDKSTTKRMCSGSQGRNNDLSNIGLSSEYLLNSPLPNRPSKACMVKLYTDFDKYVLHSLVDVVGFLSVDPALDGSTLEVDDFEEMGEVQAANPPPSLIPRLHAIFVRALDHVNPLLDETFLQIPESVDNVEAIHKDMQVVLTQCLFGDAVAAEFLLSNLISNVFLRTDLKTLGQFSLNICAIPASCLPSYTSALYDIIQFLLPASHYFPMTLENMNTQQFLPKKDFKTNKLVSGLLQLAPQTHLVLDETRLSIGKLEDNGVRGIQSLADLIKFQHITANFQFFEMRYDMNIPILTLSEGRSMLPCDFQIPLKPDADCIPLFDETLKAAKHYIQPKLNAIRKYLTSSKLLQLTIDYESSQMIEEDFVTMRKQDPKFGPDELNYLLMLSRLLATARGKTVLNKDVWDLAKNLQTEQRKRIEALPKRK